MKRPSITRRRFLSAILAAATLFGWELVNSLPVNAKFLHGGITQSSGSSSSLFSLNLNNIGIKHQCSWRFDRDIWPSFSRQRCEWFSCWDVA
jgi:hypothetical protein